MRDAAYYIGKPVTSLQTMLRTVAADDEAIPRIVPDGIYGAQTMRAVKAFQRRASLPPTGVTDLTTWNAVCEAFLQARIETEPASPLLIDLSPHQTIEPGSRNLHVTLIQAMLHTVAGSYANLCDCDVCGVCDDRTVQAVRSLQHACGMEETGCIDKAFWRLLCGLYAQVTGNGEPQEATSCAETESGPEKRLPCVHAEDGVSDPNLVSDDFPRLR